MGGAGNDTADYSGSPRGVRVDLRRGTGRGEGKDVLAAVETSSAHASAIYLWATTGDAEDDAIDGDAGKNTVRDRLGQNVIVGVDGPDSLNDAGEIARRFQELLGVVRRARSGGESLVEN